MVEFRPIWRPGTSDHIIWNEVFSSDEYHLPSFLPPDAVIDIGAHTGAFTCACLAKGSRCITAFEPDVESYSIAQQNISKFVRCFGIAELVRLNPSAVWRSDRLDSLKLTRVRFSEFTNSLHHAAQSTLFSDDDTYAVNSVGLDALLREFSEVALLKLDCEGAEWPILFTSKALARVKRLIVEVHSLPWKSHELQREISCHLKAEFGHLTVENLKSRLRSFGLKCKQDNIRYNIFGVREYYYGTLHFQRAV